MPHGTLTLAECKGRILDRLQDAGAAGLTLTNRAEDLQVRLALHQPPLIGPAQGYVHIDIPRPKPDAVRWSEVMSDPAYQRHPSPVALPVGIGVNGELVLADLADPNCCHALVAGSAGSGKSELLKSLVASLLHRNQPKALKLTIIDPKVLTFGSLKGSPYLTGPVITDLDDAVVRLDEAVAEMAQRYSDLAHEGFENLGQRLASGRQDLPFHVIVFDEFADLILTGRETKQRFENLVARLAAKGRAAGMHLILTTQRPDRKVVTGLIKANLPLRVCLRVNSATDSQIVLDEPGGESLLGRGDLLCNRGRGLERAQSPYIDQEELLRLANSARSNA